MFIKELEDGENNFIEEEQFEIYAERQGEKRLFHMVDKV